MSPNPHAVVIVLIILTLIFIFLHSYLHPNKYEYSKIQKQSSTFEQPLKMTDKWIVITTIQQPTEDVKRLAALPDWTLVVVGDKNTPTDWQLPDVHYLSPDTQESLGFNVLKYVPWGSYDRKNIGYLYAIKNGAEWIYDTDDDNKPYGKGLDQFDYNATIMGLRFVGIENSTELSDHLLNPYRHFGVQSMWPRGFPLELIKDHVHKDGSYRLCQTMRTSAIQQGIVHKDPDVDAIYRLLHASPSSGLQERFNKFAPTVTLSEGTFSPINSQNTLFRRDAFFALFLPLSVAFRVCDIWRGYYAQILLHQIGETMSFVPANARQLRNAHNYLADFEQEIDLYEKSGELLQFARDWRCASKSLQGCMIDLAVEFGERQFWSEEEIETIHQWIEDLEAIGYEFPGLAFEPRSAYPLEHEEMHTNCRRAHFHAELDHPEKSDELALIKAEENIRNFNDLKEWCGELDLTKSDQWRFPNREKAAEKVFNNGTLRANQEIVAIITKNFPWYNSMGLLQRIYEGSFAHIIFCGTIPYPMPEYLSGPYPKVRTPFSYVHLSTEEVNKGFWMYACIVRVAEMRLQNVKGYVMFSDDVVYNVWHPLNYSLMHNYKRNERNDGGVCDDQVGHVAAKRAVDLIRNKYSENDQVQWMMNEYRGLLAHANITNNGTRVMDPLEHLVTVDGWCISDWLYMPAEFIDFTRILGQICLEAGLFHEIFFSKLMWILPHQQ